MNSVPPPYVNRGAVYMFNEPATGWVNRTENAKLTPTGDSAVDDDFGASLALSGSTLVVGAPRASVTNNRGQGAAYVFAKPAGGWVNATQSAIFAATDGVANAGFGSGVAIGGAILAGAPGANTNHGAAYVFAVPAAAVAAAPAITSAAPTTASTGQRYSYQIKTSAAAATKMTYALGTAPAGMYIDATTGLVTWLPTLFQVGSNAVTIVATDPSGHVSQQSFRISVTCSFSIVPLGPLPAGPKVRLIDQLFSTLGKWW
jgi:hypothetical protein